MHLSGRVKIVFKNIHTLNFKRFKVFNYNDMTCWFTKETLFLNIN